MCGDVWGEAAAASPLSNGVRRSVSTKILTDPVSCGRCPSPGGFGISNNSRKERRIHDQPVVLTPLLWCAAGLVHGREAIS